MPTVTFSYTVTALMESPAANFGYAVRIPCSNGRQMLKRQHYAVPGRVGGEKRDPLGNQILTGAYVGTGSRLAFTISGKASIDPAHPEDGGGEGLEAYSDPTERTKAGGLLRVCYLHHSAVGDAVDRTRHYSLMMQEEFSCRAGLRAHRTAEEAMEDRSGPPEDLAHIVLALCRLDGISARYVTGITGHGASPWVEVWNGLYWIPVDPLSGETCDHHYLKLAHGRDGGDVTLAALSRGCRIAHLELHSTLTVDHSRTH